MRISWNVITHGHSVIDKDVEASYVDDFDGGPLFLYY